jgi:hypothetical protein
MALVNFTNTGKTCVHIDGKSIMPGESRQVDETQVPGYGIDAEYKEQEHEINPLAEILLGNVPSVLLALADLTAEQLLELEILETDAAMPRKGVLEGIDKRQLELAQESIA